MNHAIEILMHEHRVIEQVLTALESFSARVVRAEAADRGTVRDFVDFFANFADRCHHGKEEDRLFARMTEYGFSRDGGPVGVMLAEHTAGREHVAALRSIAEGSGELADSERQAIGRHASAYNPLLRQHIAKEDAVLYPMAERVIPEADFAQMARDFDEFERAVMGAGEHERFHAIADALIARYVPASGAATEAGTSCCGHQHRV